MRARVSLSMSLLHRDRQGATAVEFALVAPILLMFLFMIVEGARLLWTQQALQETAASSVRCWALKSPCSSAALTRSYATNRASGNGVDLGNAIIDVTSGQNCHGLTQMNKVTIQLPYQAFVPHLLPGAPATLVASACFPPLPSSS